MLSFTNVPLFSYDNKSSQIVHVTILVILSFIFIIHFKLVMVTVDLEFILRTLGTGLILGASWDYTRHGTPGMQSNMRAHTYSPTFRADNPPPMFFGRSEETNHRKKMKNSTQTVS